LDNLPETRLAIGVFDGRGAGVSVERISYHGWPDCYLVANKQVEVVVVPAIGRVMQLRLRGEADGAFWENRALDGQLHLSDSAEWINFGGDKCWPAPQSAWPEFQGREWPPPIGFDSLLVEAVATKCGVTLTSPVDPGFGIQVVRHVELDAEQPFLRIRTEYRKLAGAPVRVSVWTIAQMREPERVFVLLPEHSEFADGYFRLMEAEPEQLRIEGALLSLARHPRVCVKIGSDATSMAWVGRKCAVRIDAEPGPGEYPDGGCVTQVYTNPDPLPYVELETLGPLAKLSAGKRIERTAVYTIRPRSTPDPEAEARKIFGLQ
jgi:hypothetical protein